MTTLFQLTLDLARLISDVFESTATASHSATSMTDSANTEDTSYWVGGTIWWLTGLNIGKTAIPTVFAATVFTYLTTTTLCEAGDAYACCIDEYPRRILRQKINQALRKIGSPELQDASLVTVANQEEYDIPTVVAPGEIEKIFRVEIAASLTSPYKYEPVTNWRVIGAHLHFIGEDIPGIAGYKIRLTYKPKFVELTTDAGVVSDLISYDRILWKAAVLALQWNFKRGGSTDQDLARLLLEALGMEKDMDNLHPYPTYEREGRLGGEEESPPEYW